MKSHCKSSLVFYVILFAFVLPFGAFASPNDSTPTQSKAPTLLYTDHVYKPTIKTVRLLLQGDELSPPLITLDGEEQLELSFDDLSQDIQTYSYTFVLCNSDWTPADLPQFDYLGSYLESEINNYSMSSGTRVPFVHYSLLLPNSDVTLTKSGNYLLKVYKDNNPDSLVLTRRFYVLDSKVSINAQMRIPNIPEYSSTHQEVQFSLLVGALAVTNPFDEIKVTVMQNFRSDNAYTNLKPQFVKEDSLIYRNEGKIIFPGVKEFRYFDTRNILTLTAMVKDYDYATNTIYLFPEEIRSFKAYDYLKDNNGRFVIGKQDAQDSVLQADYINVHFRLNTNSMFPGAKLYVFGALSDWQATPDFQLDYNFKDRAYEKDILLKQGFYNYIYAYKRDDSKEVEANLLEGSSYETENDYQILVYYHPTGSRYDQFVGLKILNSLKK